MRARLLVVMVIGATSCIPSRSNKYDPGRCPSVCAAGQTCIDGQCAPLTSMDCTLPSDCNDGLTCTTDACDGGKCKFTRNPSTCIIDGKCRDDGATSDTGPCLRCDAKVAADRWTPAANGSSCDDGQACTHTDICQAGTCAGTPYSCDDGIKCTTDTCTGDNKCLNTPPSNQCVIEKMCFDKGDVSTSDNCLICAPEVSTHLWTAAPKCVSTVGGGGGHGATDGPAVTTAQMAYPGGVAVDDLGRVYAADTDTHLIRLIATGVVTTIAGSGAKPTPFDEKDKPALQVSFNGASGLALDGSGRLWISDEGNHAIRVLHLAGSSKGTVSLVAGNGTAGYVDETGNAARFSRPVGIASYEGVLYVADFDNNVIRHIVGSKVTTFVGKKAGGFRDGLAVGAPAGQEPLFSGPVAVAVSNHRLYVADRNNHRIRMIELKTAGNPVTTLAGDGIPGWTDGAANTSRLHTPEGVAVDAGGNVYFTEGPTHRLRVISGGTVSTLAGATSTGGEAGFKDGKGSAARFNYPSRIALGPGNGRIYIADVVNDRIRLYTP